MAQYKFGSVTIAVNAGVVSSSPQYVTGVTFIAHPDNAGTIYVRASNILIPVPKTGGLSLGRGNLATITASGTNGDRLYWTTSE